MNSVSPKELKQWMEEGKPFQLVDIREAWERELFNIGGTHLPLSEFSEHIADISKNLDVVLYCEKGIRSSILIQRLEGYGYTNLYNLSGGMKAWKEA